MSSIILSNNSEESFSFAVNDVIYKFRQLWNENGFWTLDIFDENEEALIYGVKLVAGFDLLSRFPHIPFSLTIPGDVDPERYTLSDSKLVIV